jgi:hypothetical protein
MRLHGVHEITVRAGRVVRNTDVANEPLVFPIGERAEVRVEINQVVDLHEVDALRAESLQGSAHLGDTVLLSARPDLGCEEDVLAQLEFVEEVSNDGFGPSIHWRRIDDASSSLDERVQYATERFAFGVGDADVEGLPRPEPDGGMDSLEEGMVRRRSSCVFGGTDCARLAAEAPLPVPAERIPPPAEAGGREAASARLAPRAMRSRRVI